MDPVSTHYAPRAEVSLRLTLSTLTQGSTDPTIRRDASGWWLALRLASGTATLLLRERADAIDATAWGAGAAEAIAGVPDLLGAADDDDGFEPGRHPVIAQLHHRTRGPAAGAHAPHPGRAGADRARPEGDRPRGQERVAGTGHPPR